MSMAIKYAMQKRAKRAMGGEGCEACRGGECMEHGGMVDGDDMVGRIMKKRYSEGGMVANDTPPEADFEENEFDDLVKDDHLEFHETGANSGDHLGNEEHDEEDHDMVSRIMRSRGKRDRLPRPA